MIASYGLKFILIGAVITILASLWAASKDSLTFYIISLVTALLTLSLLFFYRNPSRNIPDNDLAVLSIADGKVLSVDEISNDYIGGKGRKVAIFLSVLDAHINRIPIDGRVDYYKYNPGKFFAAFKDKASSDNENTEIGLVFSDGKMIFKQIAGIMARRIECTIKESQKVEAGEIYGMIHFGSRAEFFLPDNIEITVKPGDMVKAGETIIGRILRK
jgi:phosphatidylserine decarboxylase